MERRIPSRAFEPPIKRLIISSAMFLPFLLTQGLRAKPPRHRNPPAHAFLIKLSSAKEFNVRSTSEHGLILVALQDCSALVDGKAANLMAGNYDTFVGSKSVKLARTSATPASFVLIDVFSAQQPLTIQTNTLVSHGRSEDASDRNVTLLMAIDSLRVADSRDLRHEGLPWQSIHHRNISLRRGDTVWLSRGLHRFKNNGTSTARFVTVEW